MWEASLPWWSPPTWDRGNFQQTTQTTPTEYQIHSLTILSSERISDQFNVQDWPAAQHRDGGDGKSDFLLGRTFHNLVLPSFLHANFSNCLLLRWGYLAMNSASTFGVEGTRWLQSAKATAQTLLNTFGGAGVGLVLCYCFYGHIIPVGKMVNCTMGSLVSNTAITFLCTATEVIIKDIKMLLTKT